LVPCTASVFLGVKLRARLSLSVLAWVVFVSSAVLPNESKALGVDEMARILAGLERSVPADVDLPEAQLQQYARGAARYWAEYERRIGGPMQKWAQAELEQPRAATIFYPFSGPDFATVYRFYPGAERYVLVALQRARPLPALDKASAAEVAAFFARFGESWKQFAQIGFFRTLDLDDDAKQPGIRAGTTAPLIAFAARYGFKIVNVQPVRVNAAGTDLEVHPGRRAHAATWASVRISLERNARKVALDYVLVNLADASLKAQPAVRAWVERMAGRRTVLKAASHLLQDPRFAILRDALLARAPGIVQDETGIDYTRLTRAFNVRLYGHFSKPHPLFNQESQRSLAQAYAVGTDIKPLPFRVSYQRLPEANLQVAVRVR